jgi:hypothetical protein
MGPRAVLDTVPKRVIFSSVVYPAVSHFAGSPCKLDTFVTEISRAGSATLEISKSSSESAGHDVGQSVQQATSYLVTLALSLLIRRQRAKYIAMSAAVQGRVDWPHEDERDRQGLSSLGSHSF